MADQNASITEAFKEVYKKLDYSTMELAKFVAERTYTKIMLKWPVYTGWSAVNNKIAVGTRQSTTPTPATRPSKQGALEGSISGTMSMELAKLDRLQIGRTYTIQIYNPVPYAADVGFNAGLGEVIYAEAAMEAKAEADRLNLGKHMV